MIDAGGDASTIISHIRERDLKLEWICATHGHLDHILAASELRTAFPGSRTVIGEDDRFLWDAFAQQAEIFGMPIDKKQIPGPPDFELQGDVEMKWQNGDVFGKALATPGHSPGSTCYYFPTIDFLSTGDTLFQQSEWTWP